MAASRAGRSIGFIRCGANPAERLSSMSSDEPKPESAIAGDGAGRAERLDELQAGAVGQLDVADEQVERPSRRPPGGAEATPSADADVVASAGQELGERSGCRRCHRPGGSSAAGGRGWPSSGDRLDGGDHRPRPETVGISRVNVAPRPGPVAGRDEPAAVLLDDRPADRQAQAQAARPPRRSSAPLLERGRRSAAAPRARSRRPCR